MSPLIGLGLGVFGAAGKMIERGRANKQMNKLLGEDPEYVANPIADQRLALAQQLLNARMPGAQQFERNILSNQGNQLYNINKNATDSSQALALASGVYGNSQNAFGDMALQELQDYQRRYGNVVNAEQGVINEGDKVFQDKIRRFEDKAKIKGAQSANRAANWGDLSNLGFGIMDFGMSGGFDQMFSKKNSRNNYAIPAMSGSGSVMDVDIPGRQ